jgi:hypothetical protein
MSKLTGITALLVLASAFTMAGLAGAAESETTPSVVPTVESDKPAGYRLE